MDVNNIKFNKDGTVSIDGAIFTKNKEYKEIPMAHVGRTPHCEKTFILSNGIVTVPIRSFDVEYCIENNKYLKATCPHFSGEFMMLSPEELKSNLLSASGNFNSKHGGEPYKLYNYRWINSNIK